MNSPEHYEPESRFSVLSGYAQVISGLGWIVIIAGAISVLIGITNIREMGILGLLGGVIAVLGVVIVAAGQAISCIASIEKYIRGTYELLQSGQLSLPSGQERKDTSSNQNQYCRHYPLTSPPNISAEEPEASPPPDYKDSEVEVFKRHSEMEENAKMVAHEETADDSIPVKIERTNGEEHDLPETIKVFACPWCNKAYQANVKGTNIVFRCIKCNNQSILIGI
jgi:hypothetical protein